MTPHKMTGAEIRQTFIDFFVEHGHTAVPSASLVPGGDSTLLFTNSGMVQFKDVFIGTDKRPYTRAVDSQKCMRVAGKHNDLEDVGRDGTHHTFFEMLGNWSFGDYYKKEAIEWAWQLLTDVWGLDKQRLYTTVFKDEKGEIPTDEEAAKYWLAQPGYDPSHLFYMGRKDNFWEMADTGPCGPCSEIHYDLRPGTGPVDEEVLDSDRFVELWNLVFMQYNRLGPTQLEPLPATHVDTGMGFERLVSILQGVDSNYKTDLFTNSLDLLRSLTGHSEEEMYADFTPYRVICDHARSVAFLIADGVVPGNVGRNYVCRMIIRRAARFGGKLNLNEPFLAKVAKTVIETYGHFYPELEKNQDAILDNLTREEVRFARTVEVGTNHLLAIVDDMVQKGETVLDGQKAFELYATYGLPLEITRDILRERYLVVLDGKLPVTVTNMDQINVDEAGFRTAMDEHRIASGGGKAMGELGGEDAEIWGDVIKELQKAKKLLQGGVHYNPYELLEVEGTILALYNGGKFFDEMYPDEYVEVLLPETGFYVESGGQVSDTGIIMAMPDEKGDIAWAIDVTEMRKPAPGAIVHVGNVSYGVPKVGDRVVARVDAQRRHDIMRNHTATHLLHAALHQVLGDMARQAGSLVAPDRLRFDFTHPEAMTPEQIERVEKIVNEAVAADMEVSPKLKAREDAIKEGAMALFGEKYGETVRTITIADFDSLEENEANLHPTASAEHNRYSYELCGGTHLDRTSDVGTFLITSEGSAAAGIRRIEAVTGRGAYDLIARRFKTLKQTAGLLKSSIEEIPHKVESLQEEVTELKKELASLLSQSALSTFDQKLSQVGQVKGVNLLAVEIPDLDKDALGKLADTFREKYPENGICVVASPAENNVIVMATVTQDLIKQGFKAGELVSHVSRQLGAGGGGAPHLAFGGGKYVDNIGEALASVSKWVEAQSK